MSQNDRPKVAKASPSRLREQAYVQTIWSYVAEAGTTPDDLLRPDFWSAIAGPGTPMRRMDKICVVLDDESFYAELLVLAVGIGFAKLALISKVDIEAQLDADEGMPVYAKWAGPHLKWTVVRKSDQARIKEHLDSREIAERWARDHVKTMAA